LSPKIDGSGIFRSLEQIVDSINFIHEAMIAKIIGTEEYKKLRSNVSSADFPFVDQRLARIRAVVAEADNRSQRGTDKTALKT